jgi:hypothetical protein
MRARLPAWRTWNVILALLAANGIPRAVGACARSGPRASPGGLAVGPRCAYHRATTAMRDRSTPSAARSSGLAQYAITKPCRQTHSCAPSPTGTARPPRRPVRPVSASSRVSTDQPAPSVLATRMPGMEREYRADLQVPAVGRSILDGPARILLGNRDTGSWPVCARVGRTGAQPGLG